jgi:polysaccharide pyruvyl transferase WcaK-like protein
MTAKEIALMKSAMNNFSYISVRDEWTKGMVETITGKQDVEVTPDPVFSFNQNCYIQLPSKEEILKKYHLKEKYILISFSTWYSKESYIRQIADEAGKRGYQPVAFPMPEKLFSAGLVSSIQLPLSPIDWYALISYSAGYIGERMHPIIVCLHNVVPFFCFDEYGIYKKKFGGLIKRYIKSSSKTYHILNNAGLEDCMFSYKENINKPSPKYVMDRIEQFDKDKCEKFSVLQQKKFDKMMNKVLNFFDE